MNTTLEDDLTIEQATVCYPQHSHSRRPRQALRPTVARSLGWNRHGSGISPALRRESVDRRSGQARPR